MTGYPQEELLQEVAYIAYHFHWSPQAILEMEHVDRQHWVEAIAAINQRLNQETSLEMARG